MIDIKFSIPYLPELSKNRRYAFYGSKVKNKAHVKAQELITYKFKEQLRSFPAPKKCKFYVRYIVYRPSKRSDSSNFANPLIDAIKICLPMDDNLCAGSWDFVEDKINPRIDIRVLIPEHEIA